MTRIHVSGGVCVVLSVARHAWRRMCEDASVLVPVKRRYAVSLTMLVIKVEYCLEYYLELTIICNINVFELCSVINAMVND